MKTAKKTMTQTVASYLCPSAGIANWSDWTRELAGVPEKGPGLL